MKVTNGKLFAYALFAASILVGMAYANYVIPICLLSKQVEALFRVASYAIIFILILPVMVYASSLGKSGKRYAPLMFFIFFCSGPLIWLSMYRQNAVEIAYWSFNGSITNKYLSSNHALESLTIGGVNYENIPDAIWSHVKIGDTIVKKSCNNVIQINGGNIHIGNWHLLHCCPLKTRK